MGKVATMEVRFDNPTMVSMKYDTGTPNCEAESVDFAKVLGGRDIQITGSHTPEKRSVPEFEQVRTG